MAGSALRAQLDGMDVALRAEAKLDGIAASLQKRTAAEERQHGRDRAFRYFYSCFLRAFSSSFYLATTHFLLLVSTPLAYLTR